MSIPAFMRMLFLPVLIVVSSGRAFAGLDKLTTLKRAMANKQVTVKALSLGGYCGRCINVHMTNNTANYIKVDVDPGLIFVPEDTNFQNLVVWGDESVELAPGATKDVSLETFCGKSYAHSPASDIKYNFWKQGDSSMIKTLLFARDNKMDPYLVQNAVWTFTNAHRLSSIYCYGMDSQSYRLVKYIADLRHMPVPEYYVYHPRNNRPGQSAMRTDSGRIIVPMQWGNEVETHVNIFVYRLNGEVYRVIDADRVTDKNGTKVNVEFDQVRDIRGSYIVQAKDIHNKVLCEKKVEVDF